MAENAIVQCVPNFSEGRRPEIIDELLEPVEDFGSVELLDYHSDSDHNRTVVTLAGAPDPLRELVFELTRRATRLLDMEQHSGSHPRIGATDVIPFIPISGVSMEDCVELARSLGKQIADKLSLPVYLYEEAALRPDRRDLAVIRRGEYEQLKEELVQEDRRPDFGPAQMHPTAGATVVGARMALIAYNVYLDTEDLSIARTLARAVRASSGGFANVKAIGLEVEDRSQVQVSMNLTNYKRTPIWRVYSFLKREARHRGVDIAGSELVGLVPAEALLNVARDELLLEDFGADQVLDLRLKGLRE
jgi:glutamate formiminotransferase